MPENDTASGVPENAPAPVPAKSRTPLWIGLGIAAVVAVAAALVVPALLTSDEKPGGGAASTPSPTATTPGGGGTDAEALFPATADMRMSGEKLIFDRVSAEDLGSCPNPGKDAQVDALLKGCTGRLEVVYKSQDGRYVVVVRVERFTEAEQSERFHRAMQDDDLAYEPPTAMNGRYWWNTTYSGTSGIVVWAAAEKDADHEAAKGLLTGFATWADGLIED